jgi:F0F1-type ATP synthase epsilon subunit
MLGRISGTMTGKLARGFAEEVRQKMALTLRSPYKTFFNNFDGFTRIQARTNEGVLVIQSKQPAAAYVLLPGSLKVQLSEERKDTSGEYVHSGGFAVIHPNNTVEINLVECFEKGDLQLNKVGEADLKEGADTTTTGRYVEKIRREAKKDYLRFA